MALTPERLALVAVTPDDETVRERGLAGVVASLIDGGVTAVMFREKSLDDETFTSEALAVRDVCRRLGAAFLLNERVDLAGRVEPDAIHLTHASPDPAAARALCPDATFGISVHSAEEAAATVTAEVAYVVFGPIFDTPSKRGVLAPRGLDSLTVMCKELTVPVVAIGGIGARNVAAVRRAGAAGVAVIRALFSTIDPAAAARRLVSESRS